MVFMHLSTSWKQWVTKFSGSQRLILWLLVVPTRPVCLSMLFVASGSSMPSDSSMIYIFLWNFVSYSSKILGIFGVIGTVECQTFWTHCSGNQDVHHFSCKFWLLNNMFFWFSMHADHLNTRGHWKSQFGFGNWVTTLGGLIRFHVRWTCD
jgi:hypothetical protein